MNELRPALFGLAALGVIEAGAAAAILATSSDPAVSTFEQVSVPVIGGLWFGTGLLAWLRRPENRTGALMALAGATWLFAAATELWSAPAAVVIGYVMGPLYVVAVAHLALAYPSGRLPSRSLRALVGGLYFTATLGQLPGLLMAHIGSTFREDSTTNPLLVHATKLSSEWLGAVTEAVGVVLLALAVRALVRRWRVASPPRRRLLAPVIWPAVGMFVLLSAVLVVALASLPDAVGDAVWIGVTICFAAIPLAFLAGLVRTRASGVGAVGDLMARLQNAPATGKLRDALAAALRDPSIELAYWLPAQGSYVDAEGRPFELPGQDDSRRAVAEIEHDGRPVAAIVHDASLLDQPELIQSVGAAAALALENERLDAELRARIEEVRSSRTRLIHAEEAARRRLERSLHDGPQQRLVALALGMRTARARLPEHPDAAAELIETCEKELTTTIDELRELARGIHPAVLTDRGLQPALEALRGRFPIPVELGELPEERLPAPVESAAYLVISEALANSARYSRATHATVSVARRNGHALVEVRDNGVGGADPSRGNGLRALVDRVGALDGSLELVSAPGEGTIVYAEIPCA